MTYPTPIAVSSKERAIRVSRNIIHLVFGTIDVHAIRMVFVIFRQRTNTVRAQEFGFVKHLLKNPLELGLAHQSEKHPVSFTSLRHTRKVTFSHITVVLDKPINTLLEAGEFFDELWLKGHGGVKRNQAHEGSNGHFVRMRPAVANSIVVESMELLDA